MLSRKRGNPNVVGRQRHPSALQLLPNERIARGGLFDERKHVPECAPTRQPRFVFTSATGGRDPEAVLSQHDDRNMKLIGACNLLHNWSHVIGKRRQRVGIENHCLSSGSMFSNSASITRSI